MVLKTRCTTIFEDGRFTVFGLIRHTNQSFNFIAQNAAFKMFV